MHRWSSATTTARDTNRGTPQGGVISPLLANLYFRRFMLAWYHGGYARRLQAEVVNYADDFVILCREGTGDEALATMRRLMSKLGLTVNEKKTRLVKLPEERFDFLGYTVGQFYGYEKREIAKKTGLSQEYVTASCSCSRTARSGCWWPSSAGTFR